MEMMEKIRLKVYIYIYMYYICLDGECLMQQIFDGFDGFELHWGPPINDGHKDKH